MLKKISFILMLISFSICLGLMSSTYSRYVADTTGNIEVLFAKWQILVNENNITDSSSSSITFVPVIEENENIASNTVAPTSKGYFDIDINPTNVDVSFKYNISLGIENENIPDLMITKYAIFNDSYDEEDPLKIITLTDNTITNNLIYDKDTESFSFEPFTIRIYFEWYEGIDEQMNDSDDTVVGHLAALEDTTFKMNAHINFEQMY